MKSLERLLHFMYCYYICTVTFEFPALKCAFKWKGLKELVEMGSVKIPIEYLVNKKTCGVVDLRSSDALRRETKYINAQ